MQRKSLDFTAYVCGIQEFRVQKKTNQQTSALVRKVLGAIRSIDENSMVVAQFPNAGLSATRKSKEIVWSIRTVLLLPFQ